MSPITSTYILKGSTHHQKVSEGLNRLRLENSLTDVTLICEDKQLQAHRAVLSVCSSYFENIIRQNRCDHPVIIIHGIKYNHLSSLLDFVYTGELEMPPNEIPELLQAARVLKINELVNETDQKSSGNHSREKDENAFLKKISPQQTPERPKSRLRENVDWSPDQKKLAVVESIKKPLKTSKAPDIFEAPALTKSKQMSPSDPPKLHQNSNKPDEYQGKSGEISNVKKGNSDESIVEQALDLSSNTHYLSMLNLRPTETPFSINNRDSPATPAARLQQIDGTTSLSSSTPFSRVNVELATKENKRTNSSMTETKQTSPIQKVRVSRRLSQKRSNKNDVEPEQEVLKPDAKRSKRISDRNKSDHGGGKPSAKSSSDQEDDTLKEVHINQSETSGGSDD